MGLINDVFSQNKLSLKKFDEILTFLLKISPNKVQNNKILQEIGLINEYASIITDKEPNETIYCSKKYRIVQNIKFLIKMRENFLKWVKYLFDINNTDLDSMQLFNKKIELIKNINLTKEYFQNNIKKYIFKDKQFLKLFNYGIPPNLRLFIWNIIITEKYSLNHKSFNYEEELALYRSLLQANNKNKSQNVQIEKDLNRTIIKEKEQTSNNLQILKNILYCIDNYNSSGYCQGMNFIIGFLLKLTNYNEVFAFYIFKHILKEIKGYFEENLPLLKKNLNFFENNFIEMYPKIYKHFKKHEIINEFYISKWLQTLFSLILPFEELCIIWDILLLKGFDFIVFICLAYFDFIKDDIINIKDSGDILFYLEKSLNSEGESLIPINHQFFEQIDEYIIPLNEIIEKAQEIEKKIGNKNNNNNNLLRLNNKNFYEGRKSDNHLMNFNFNSEKRNSLFMPNKTNINIDNNLSDDNNNLPIKKNISNKINTLHGSYNQNIKNNNINVNINLNHQLPKSTSFTKIIEEKPNYYSTKNLGIYNFKDIQLEANNVTKNQINLNNFGFNIQNNNIHYNNNMYNGGVNYGNNILLYKP